MAPFAMAYGRTTTDPRQAHPCARDRALDDDNAGRFVDIGGNIPGKAKRGQQPLAALVKSEIARWTPIIKAANIKAE
jgi:hypothetical protein